MRRVSPGAADSRYSTAVTFPATRVSLVARTRSLDERTRQLAFETLIEAYWKPIYKYLRLKWKSSPDEAADLTQDFFANALEKEVVGRYDPGRARFRTYLRLCVDGFVANARKAERRLKRGGGIVILPLDCSNAETELQAHLPSVPPEAEELFDREFSRSLLQGAIDDLRATCLAADRSVAFTVFERYDLADELQRPTYAVLAAELGLTTAMVTNHLAAVRRDFRRHILDRLRRLTATNEEFELEARRLLGRSR